MSDPERPDQPQGYRTPASSAARPIIPYEPFIEEHELETKVGAEPATGADGLPAQSPGSFLANAVLLNAITTGALMLRIEVPADTTTLLFLYDDGWADEVTLPRGLVAQVARRLRIMAGVDPNGAGHALVGSLAIQLGEAEQIAFRVLVRPTATGDRLLVRPVPARELAAEERGLSEPLGGEVGAQHELAQRMMARQDFSAAADAARALLAAAEPLGPRAATYVLEARHMLCHVAIAGGDVAEAIEHLRANLPGVQKLYGDESLRVAELLMELSHYLLQSGAQIEGAATAREAGRIAKSAIDASDPVVWAALAGTADLLGAAGERDEARRLWDEAIDGLTHLVGDDDLELMAFVTARRALDTAPN